MIAYVESSDGIGEFYERLTPLLDYLLPAYEQEGKAHLTSASAAPAAGTARS